MPPAALIFTKPPAEFNSNIACFCLTRFHRPAQPCRQMAAPNPWMILPFALLLGAMAFAPLRAPRWWLNRYAWVGPINMDNWYKLKIKVH